MRKVLAAFARNTVFANILLTIIFLAGAMAATSMIRETFPEFSMDAIQVAVVYPGADPEEVEEGVSRKIEEAIQAVQGIKQYNTTSAEGLATAWIEVHEDYGTPEVLDRVRSKIDAISTFPADAEEPIVSEFLLRDVVLMLALSGQMSEQRMKEWAESIKDEVLQLPVVSQVEVFGAREYEIAIEVSEERLRQYGISLNQVAQAVRRSSLNLAGGTIRTEGEDIRVRTVGRKYTGREFADIVVMARPGGDVVTLDRVATIRDTFSEDPLFITLNGERGMGLIIYKTPAEDSLEISKAVTEFVERKKLETPGGVEISVLYDISSSLLRARIRLLVKNGVIGLSIVFLLLWVFLDLRLSFWAGMGMPISVAGALAILWGIGGTINMISLFGLIMVLGIIVDDAIVVGEAIYVHRRRGKAPLRAAVDGVCEVGLPVIAAVTTTIVAFIPLAYVGGIMGKFIRILPIVVIACLSISLIECLVLLPAHLSHLPDPDAPVRHRNPLARRIRRFHDLTTRGMEWFVNSVYVPFLGRSLRWSYVSFCVAITVLLITIGMGLGGILKFMVMPNLDGFIVTATVEFPNGTPAEKTQEAVRLAEQKFLDIAGNTKTRTGDPMVKHSLSLVGGTLDEIPRTGPHLGSVQFVLLGSEDRGIHSDKLLTMWEEAIGQIPGTEAITFHGLSAGPPGATIEIWMQGHSMDDILSAADDIKARLKTYDGVYQVQSDFRPGKNEVRLHLKPEARTLGLTVGDLASQVYAGYFGEEAVRLQRGRDDIRVRVRYTADERSRLADLDHVRIRTPDGREVPLRSVADITFAPGYSSITRTDGMRRVSVTAEVNKSKANANEIIQELQVDYFPQLHDRYPHVFVSFQGEQKKMRESFASLGIGFPLALLGIFIIVATVFRSYAQPFVIMFTVPFGIVGAIVGHMVMGYELTLLSMFGIVALSGVVVNDAIVLIEAINSNMAGGMPFLKAIEEGGRRRFRAVILTSLSTIGGLTPMIMEKDMQARILIPMALSIAFGVAFATVLTLVLIPSLLVILNDMRCISHRLKHGRWPEARVDVEPARERNTNMLEEPSQEPAADV